MLEVCHVVCEDFSSKTYAEASFCRPPVSSRIDTEPIYHHQTTQRNSYQTPDKEI